MPIAREDGFLQTHDLAHVSSLGIESARLEECVERMKTHRIKGVFGAPGFGFTGPDSFPASLTELQINWANADSLDPLPPLPNLHRLEVHRCRNLASLGDLRAKFPKLEHLVVAACGKVPASEGARVAREIPGLGHVSVQGKVFAAAARDGDGSTAVNTLDSAT